MLVDTDPHRVGRADRDLDAIRVLTCCARTRDRDGTNCRTPLIQVDVGTDGNLPLFEVLQNLGLVIRDANDASVSAVIDLTQTCCRVALRAPRDAPIGARDRVSVRVASVVAENLIHSVEDEVGHGMLKGVRLCVDIVPAEPQALNQVGLKDSMPSHDNDGDLLAGGSEVDAPVGLVVDQAVACQLLQIG